MVACQADDDQVVPPDQARRYVTAATAAGGQARFQSLPGDHFAIIDPHADAFRTTRGLVAQALRHRLALACRQVHDADPRALGREAFRCGQPAAASPAGDKGGLALQTSCHVILPCRACAPGRFPV